MIGMKRYLVIVEKPYTKKLFKGVYENIKDKLDYVADFALVDNFVVDTSCEKVREMFPKEQYEEFLKWEAPVLKNKDVGSGFRVYYKDSYYDKCRERIMKLFTDNDYNAIINACDPDESGDVSFQFMIERLSLDACKRGRLYWYSLEEKDVEKILLSLNETKTENDMIKMVKLDDGSYVPEDCCTFTNPVTSHGIVSVDDVNMPCGMDCHLDCEKCIVQKVFNEYAKITGQV